jgi:hypothetical protein
MKKRLWLLNVFFLILVLSSCQKELSFNEAETNNGNSPGHTVLSGNWKFTGATAEGQSTAELTDLPGFLTVSSMNYTTSNNNGTLKIEATKMSYTGFSYTATGAMEIAIYQGGSLLSSQSLPLSFNIPASSSSSDYKQIGSDSLYFVGGGLISIGGVGDVSQQAGGAKFKIENGKLTISAIINESTIETVSGFEQKTTTTKKATLTFQKL